MEEKNLIVRQPSGPLLLISDLDDTIKISNTQSKLVTVFRGLFRSSAFAGMAQLYSEFLAAPGSEFYLVSSSPPAIRRKIEYFLSRNKFPPARLILRDWFRQTSILKYKLSSILHLVENSPLPVLLIGDDTEHDAEVFAHVVKRHPEKVLARYVRVVRGRKLPEGTIGFFTAFDIACAEMAAGRLNNLQALAVGEAVLLADKNSRLIPWFSLKPPISFAPFLTSPDEAIGELWKKIQTRIEAIPKRKSKP